MYQRLSATIRKIYLNHELFCLRRMTGNPLLTSPLAASLFYPWLMALGLLALVAYVPISFIIDAGPEWASASGLVKVAFLLVGCIVVLPFWVACAFFFFRLMNPIMTFTHMSIWYAITGKSGPVEARLAEVKAAMSQDKVHK